VALLLPFETASVAASDPSGGSVAATFALTNATLAVDALTPRAVGGEVSG
jgi:hypothetical protein